VRIRSIKPEFWRSDDITRLRRDVRLLFIGLWSYVDDNGVGIDDHRQITADLFALEDDPVAARTFVRDGLATLSAALLIIRYEHDGKRYLYIPTWDRHQRVDKPGRPRYPRPDTDGTTIITSGNAETGQEFAEPSRESRDTLAPGAGEQRSRGTGDTDSSSPSARDAREDGRDGATDPETLTTEAPVPSPGEPKAAPRGPSRSTAGTRLPDDFPVTDTMRDWARTNTPLCGTTDHEAFCDYWRSMPGAKGRKADWVATWRNWMRREQKQRGTYHPRAHHNGTPKPSTTDERVNTALALAEQFRSEANGRKEITP
jgi:hypothetical protein